MPSEFTPSSALPTHRQSLRFASLNWRGLLKILMLSCVCLALIGLTAHRLWRGPPPEDILDRIESLPSSVLTPVEELATFRTAPGFRIELVASEPLVVDPVAMDWDDEGRLYVVEMRGFMRSLDAEGEDMPSGRVVVLEDIDHDGQMDTSRVFLDGLVLPRGIAVLPQGVLIGAPPNLLLCSDLNRNLSCEESEQSRLTHYADGPGNVEHAENGLLPGIDGWLYNAKSNRRFQLTGDASEPQIKIEKTISRGQWGIAQDDQGRLYYNHNSSFLYADAFPGEYVLRQPATGAQKDKPGLGIDLASDEQVWGVRTAAGLNRADTTGTLRTDGRQAGPEAVSALTILRGDQYGPDYVGDAFVPESGGSALAHFSIEFDGVMPRAKHELYKDPDWKRREFVASTDERFRPVDVKTGPDGALWMIDMYRGIIQHKAYMSDHLRRHVKTLGLESPGETGRIWRIVKTDEPIDHQTHSLASLSEQLVALNHPNGWVRDRAQRRIIFERPIEAIPVLRQLQQFSTKGRLHALWILSRLGALDLSTWKMAVLDPNPSVRRHALQMGQQLLPDAVHEIKAVALAGLDDEDASVRLQALHTLGELPEQHRPLAQLTALAIAGTPLARQAVLSGLAGIELPALILALQPPARLDAAWVRQLSTATLLSAQRESNRAEAVGAVLDLADQLGDTPAGRAVVKGIADTQHITGNVRVVLNGAHELFKHPSSTEFGRQVGMARSGFTWAGDTAPMGVRPLTTTETALRDRGRMLFAATCASCHGVDGRGISGLAPPLAGSSWARDSDDWLVRIALHGLNGRITVLGEDWNSSMPGFAKDPRFDDESLAGLATHVRRSWGHADQPVTVATVSSIRKQASTRASSWTADELLELSVEHRLDQYTGTYRIPVIGLELHVRRKQLRLTLGLSMVGEGPLTELSYGVFSGGGVTIAFDSDDKGVPDEAEITFRGHSFRVNRLNS